MKLVIDLPEELYNYIKSGNYDEHLDRRFDYKVRFAVKEGISFPKGHGRIMDVDKIIKKMEEREERLKDDLSIYETACVETALDMFGDTIIEADTGETEWK